MALYEYYCENCKQKFEQITSSSDKDAGRCPKCNQNNTKKLISSFAVGGQGGGHESLGHACHSCPHSQHGCGGHEHG